MDVVYRQGSTRIPRPGVPEDGVGKGEDRRYPQNPRNAYERDRKRFWNSNRPRGIGWYRVGVMLNKPCEDGVGALEEPWVVLQWIRAEDGPLDGNPSDSI